jgi:hypothetical protein
MGNDRPVRSVCVRRRVEAEFGDVGDFPDEPEPSGEPDLTVAGVPGFSGLVPGPSSSVGVHDHSSSIMDGER